MKKTKLTLAEKKAYRSILTMASRTKSYLELRFQCEVKKRDVKQAIREAMLMYIKKFNDHERIPESVGNFYHRFKLICIIRGQTMTSALDKAFMMWLSRFSLSSGNTSRQSQHTPD